MPTASLLNMSVLGPYVRILRHPGAARFSAAAFIARLPIAMVGLGIVLLVSAVSGSYGEAGLVTAAFAVSAAFINPIGSRFVDRWGQFRIVSLLAGMHAALLLLLAYAVIERWPLALAIALSALSGATQPATGALVRARWAVALGNHPSLQTAFAFESILDELIFILGPPFAAFVAVSLAPAAPLVICAVLVSVGCGLLVVQRSTQPPIAARGSHHGGSLLRDPALNVVLLTLLSIGAVFGSVDVVVVAAADEAAARAMAGIVLAAYAIGSMAAAIVLGARIPRPDLLPRRLLLATGGLVVVTVPLVFMRGLLGIGLMVLLAGLAVSPVLITSFALVERIVPARRLTEGLTWATSAIGLGVALSAALAGWLVDAGGSRAGFAVTTAAAFLTLAAAALGQRALRQRSSVPEEAQPDAI